MLPKIKTFLFDHTNTKQIIAKNTFWVAATEFLSRALKFFYVVFAARILGITEYGKLSFALAFTIFFTVFSDLGLSTIIAREVSRDREKEQWFPTMLSLKAILSLLVTATIILISFFATQDSSIRVVMWILAIYLFIQGIKSVFYPFFSARQRMEYISLLGISEAIIFTGLAFVILFTWPSIKLLSWVYVLSGALGLTLAVLVFNAKIAPIRISISFAAWKKFLAMSLPLGLIGFLNGVFGSVDAITLGIFGQINQVGWYSAAYSLFNAVFLPATVITQVFAPVLSRAFKTSKDQLQKAYNFQMEIMIFLAFGFLSGGLALSSKLINFIYKPTYSPAIFSLNFLLPAAAFLFLGAPLSLLLIACGREKQVFMVSFLAVGANVLLDLILIPILSLYGTAFATFVATLLMFFAFSYFVSTLVPIKLFNVNLGISFVSAILAGGATYFFLFIPAVAKLYVLEEILIGGIVYLLIFLSARIAAAFLI